MPFCESAADSREHLWPAWVLQRLRRPRVSGVLWERPGESLNRIGVDPAVTVRVVCRPCNHGWLGSLEGSARPVVGSLISDLALPLDSEQQGIVGRWAVKTSMVLEGTRGGSPESFFYDDSERQAFRQTQVIPTGTTVWVGRYSGKMYSYAVAMDASYDASRVVSRADVFASTFVAGRLAFQVLSLRLGPEHARRGRIELLQNPGPWDETTLQVWPVTSANLTWPPASLFTDSEGISSIFSWEQRWARQV